MSLWCPLSLGCCQRYAVWCRFCNAALTLVMQVHWVENVAGEMDPRLLLGLQGPDSRLTAPASVSDQSNVVSRSSSSAHPVKVGGWSSVLLSLIPHNAPGKPQPHLASTPASVMINPNAVSPALTSSLSEQTHVTSNLLDIFISSVLHLKLDVSQTKMSSPAFKPDNPHRASHPIQEPSSTSLSSPLLPCVHSLCVPRYSASFYQPFLFQFCCHWFHYLFPGLYCVASWLVPLSQLPLF